MTRALSQPARSGRCNLAAASSHSVGGGKSKWERKRGAERGRERERERERERGRERERDTETEGEKRGGRSGAPVTAVISGMPDRGALATMFPRIISRIAKCAGWMTA